jgi:chaperonin GroEL
MGKKQLVFADQARNSLYAGINVLARTVRPTLGPLGGNVTVDGRSRGGTIRYAPPEIIAQGQHIIRDFEVQNIFQNLGIKMIRQAAQKTDDLVGDGTSTTVLLAHALVREGMKNISAGAHPMLIRRGMERAAQVVSQALLDMAVPVRSTDEIGKVLSSAAGSSEIAEALRWAIDEIGPDGMMIVERHTKTLGIVVECTHGFQYERGYLSSYFATDPSDGSANLEHPYILVTDENIDSTDQLMPLLEELRGERSSSLLLIAPEVKENILGLLIANHQRGILCSTAVRPPAAGEARRHMMEDLCLFTGATLISSTNGYRLSNTHLSQLGRAESAHVTADSTTIVGGCGAPDLRIGRIAELKTLIPTMSSVAERQKLERRIAQLAGGLARIRVGGATSAEMENRVELVEAALASMRATIAEGILPGAGVALALAAHSLADLQAGTEEAIGVAVVSKALHEPLRQIAANSGLDGQTVLAEVQRLQQTRGDYFIGYDVLQQTYGNMVEVGIVDSCKTVRTILANAVSAATMVLTTEVLILG